MVARERRRHRDRHGLLSLAGESAFDAAILVSSDTDYLPAVEWLQARGFKVINATWANHGHELARACWASFELDGDRAAAPPRELRCRGPGGDQGDGHQQPAESNGVGRAETESNGARTAERNGAGTAEHNGAVALAEDVEEGPAHRRRSKASTPSTSRRRLLRAEGRLRPRAEAGGAPRAAASPPGPKRPYTAAGGLRAPCRA